MKLIENLLFWTETPRMIVFRALLFGGICCYVSISSFASAIKYIDLTYPIGFQTPLWPTHTRLQRVDELDGTSTDNDDWLASSYFTMSEHTSTHIDAPYHVFAGKWKLSEIPLKRLMNVPGIMIDMSWKITKANPVRRDYAVVKEDILDWERRNGMVPAGSVVFVRTGWGEKFLTDPKDYIAAEPKCCSFPGMGLSAGKLLAARGVYGVGIDTVSLDVGSTTTFPFHSYMGSRSIFLIENAANLHILPAKGFNVYLFPLPIDGGTGSPIRIFATVE